MTFNFTYPVETNGLRKVACHVYSVSQKKIYTPKVFWQYFPNDWEFKLKFYTPIVCSYLRQITKFYSVISNIDKVVLHCVP